VFGDPMFGDWHNLPELPKSLHDIWIEELAESDTPESMPGKGASMDEMRHLLTQQNPDMSRDEWVRMGMIIHHESDGSDEGLALWDEWSRQSTKYVSFGDLQVCWRSFHDTPNPVTIGALRQESIASVDEFEVVSAAEVENDPWASQKARERARFSLTQVAEIASRDPAEWLVDDLIPKADLAMMYGAPGAGKSFVALDLAFSVATGFPWFNLGTKQGPVVWVAAEAAGSMRNRAKAYAQARGLVLEHVPLWVVEQSISLMSPEDTDGLLRCVKSKEPCLIIVDTLAAASGGGNENSGENMNTIIENCRKLHAETGALVMLIHHTGKDASRGARGWSGLKAAMHTELSIYHQDGSTLRVMESTKQRDTVDGERYPFRLEVVALDMDGLESCVIDPLDSAVLDKDGVQLGGTQRIVFDALHELIGEDQNKSASIQDVYDDVIIKIAPPVNGTRDRRAETARRALTKLHENGRVTIVDDQVFIGSSLNA
jgi:hypothetical protein